MKVTFGAITCVALILLLSSCGLFVKMLGVPTDCLPQSVDVSTSDRILRGSWRGTVDEVPLEGAQSSLLLDLYVDDVGDNSYTILGTFTLGDGAAAHFVGTVRGGCVERYFVSTTTGVSVQESPLAAQSVPPPVSLEGEARDPTDEVLWTVSGSWGTEFEDSLFITIESGPAQGGPEIWRRVEISRASM